MISIVRTSIVQVLFAEIAVLFEFPRRLFARGGLFVGDFAGRAPIAFGAAPGVGETSRCAGMARRGAVRAKPTEIAACALGRSVFAVRCRAVWARSAYSLAFAALPPAVWARFAGAPPRRGRELSCRALGAKGHFLCSRECAAATFPAVCGAGIFLKLARGTRRALLYAQT